MYRLLHPTDLALNFTTPVKNTSTPLHHDHLLRAVPSPATHYVATVHSHRSVVALPPVGALDAQLRILLAEAGRHLVVHQILVAGGFVIGVDGFELEAVLVLLPLVLPLGVDAVGDGVDLGVLGQAVAVGLVGVPVVAGVGGGDV